jgi:heme oxygenase
MKDLRAKLEKLRTDAEDCDLIGRLATDKTKRETFRKLATRLRSAAADVEAAIAQKIAAGDTR